MVGGDVARSRVVRQLEAHIDDGGVLNEIELLDAQPGDLGAEQRLEVGDRGPLVGVRPSSVTVWVRWPVKRRGWSPMNRVTMIAPISAGVIHAGETLIPPSSPIARAAK